MSVTANNEGYVIPPHEVSYSLEDDHPASRSPKRSSTPPKWLLIVVGLIILLSLCLLVAYLHTRISDLQQTLARFEDSEDKLEKEQALLRKELNESSVVKLYQNRSSAAAKTKMVADHLYTNAKEKHYLDRAEYIEEMSHSATFNGREAANVSFQLALNNYKLVHQNIHIERKIKALLQKEYDRLSKEHDFTLPELPFCMVVPTRNNGQDFRYQYNIQSLYNQNYTNFKVVVIDDASDDNTFELTQAFIEENPIPQSVYIIKNKERMSALANIYRAATQFCDPEDIMALIDGDDELLGVNVLKVFNSIYTRKKLDVLYSNFLNSNRRAKSVGLGWSRAYTPDEKKFSLYRDFSTQMFPLRSFRVSTFLKIPVANMQDDAGVFFMSASDQTICPQVLELSCGKNEYLDEHHYFRNAGLGSNDMDVDPGLNSHIVWVVRNKRKRLGCDP